MCGVIGIRLNSPTQKDFDLITQIFIESKIRGMHATGISYISENKLVTIKEPIASDEFVKKYFTDLEKFLNVDGNLYLIGHCRYSTSDLIYNQPIFNDNLSIVHNGVISQELPENWKKLYGYDCTTKNDSELILLSKNPIVEFNHMSMSVCSLSSSGELAFFRNTKRPCYLTKVKNGYIITSTENIAHRCGLVESCLIEANSYYKVSKGLTITKNLILQDCKDLQMVIYE